MDQQRKPRAIIEASLLRAKRSEIQKFETIGGKNAGAAIEETGKSSGTDALPRKEISTFGISSCVRLLHLERQQVGRRDALGRRQLANAVEGSKNDAPVAHPYKMTPG